MFLRWVSCAVLVGSALVLTACGGGGESDSGAGALAKQQELAAVRHQAAQDARQSAHIAELERKLRHANHDRTSPSAPGSPAPTATGTTSGSSLGDWPGGSGYTAILGSLASQPEARELQREATDRGLDAGVLLSSDFSSLRPGYWVVFSGTFSSEDEAAGRAGRAQQLGYSDAYPRFVAP